MTRRGTLAYYLAAWVVGCFVIALLFSVSADPANASIFLMTYFFSLMGGLVGLLLFAFLLRRVMHLLAAPAVWAWMLAGAAIFSALVYVLALASLKRPEAWWTGIPLTISNLVFGGASAVRRTGFWQAPIDGALTAIVLCLVDRAFARNNGETAQKPQPKQSPA